MLCSQNWPELSGHMRNIAADVSMDRATVDKATDFSIQLEDKNMLSSVAYVLDVQLALTVHSKYFQTRAFSIIGT